MKHLSLLLWFTCSLASLYAQTNACPDKKAGDWLFDVGATRNIDRMTYGWQRPVYSHGGSVSVCWTTNIEADVEFTIDSKESLTDYEFWVKAAPMMKTDKQQRIGLFLNNKFIEEWVCPHDSWFYCYYTVIPKRYFKLQKNTLTLRTGYILRDPKLDIKKGIQVDAFLMRPIRKEEEPE